MYLRLLSILLATLMESFWETAGIAETTRTTNELIGPVRSVTIKKLGYSATENYDRAGHLIEAVIDMAHANTATYSLFRYDQDWPSPRRTRARSQREAHTSEADRVCARLRGP